MNHPWRQVRPSLTSINDLSNDITCLETPSHVCASGLFLFVSNAPRHHFRFNRGASLEICWTATAQIIWGFSIKSFRWIDDCIYWVAWLFLGSAFTSVRSPGAVKKQKCFFLHVWFQDKYQICCLWRETASELRSVQLHSSSNPHETTISKQDHICSGCSTSSCAPNAPVLARISAANPHSENTVWGPEEERRYLISGTCSV